MPSTILLGLWGRFKPKENQRAWIAHDVLHALDYSKLKVVALPHHKLRNDLPANEQINFGFLRRTPGRL
jgi:hypothetical protein